MTMPLELQAARLRLAKDRPYLGAALWAMVPVEKPGLGTMAVDRWWRMYYDPSVTTKWSVEELAGAIYHEACHLLRDHAARFEAVEDGIVANLATDAEINDDLGKEKVRLPGQPVTPETLCLPPDWLAEEYYEALVKARTGASAGSPSEQAGQAGQAGSSADAGADADKAVDGKSGNSSSGSGDGASAPSADGSPSRDEDGAGSGSGGDPSADPAAGRQPMPGAGRCGSCATGQAEPWEDGPPASAGGSETSERAGGDGGSSPAPGVGRVEAELIRRDVARQVAEASTGRGDVPAHWKRWAEARLQPRVDWRRELAAMVRRAVAEMAGAVDYTYRRPNRRQGQVGNGRVIMPSLRRPVPQVAVVVDTSGSIDDQTLAQALAEVGGVLRACGQREGIDVLAVDAAVHSCRRVFRPEQVRLAGGGGTDMGVGIDAAVRRRPRPDVVVVLTDGYTPWPDRPPKGVRIVVGILGDNPDSAPDWARTVRIQVGTGGGRS